MTTKVGRIVLWDEDEVNDSLWMPLILFITRGKDEGVSPWLLHELDFRDFMLMHGVERKPRPFLYVYKHTESRRELAVDKDGSPYRYLPRADGSDGQYRTSDFRGAVWQLDPLFLRDVREQRLGIPPAVPFDDDLWSGEDVCAPIATPAADPWEPPPRARRLRLVR
jgi:hypothetical protein